MSDLMHSLESLKKSLMEEYGENVGQKLYCQILKDTANGVAYTTRDNPIAEYKRMGSQ